MVPWLAPGEPFPPIERARRRPNGLIAAGGDLSVPRLVDAYRRGIFPWPDAEGDPLLWWSPDPRMVLVPSELRVSKSLRKRLRAGTFRVSFDEAPAEVVAACAGPRDGTSGTWITGEIRQAYLRLHAAAYMHTVEAWAGSELAGGLYGVAIGRMFYGESMFTRRTDASKVALAWLARQLERWGFTLIDCQAPTGHLASLGAKEIPRAAFLRELAVRIAEPPPPLWRFDAGLAETF